MSNSTGHCLCGCGQPTKTITRTRSKRGQKRGDFAEYVKGHNRNPFRNGYIETDCGHTTPCRIWTGSTNSKGYATGHGAGEFSGRIMEVVWRESYGAKPEGFHLHHLCEMKACIRPDHIIAVAPTEHPRLHRRIPADIRAAILTAQGSQREIATRFGVSKTHVGRIRREEA